MVDGLYVTMTSKGWRRFQVVRRRPVRHREGARRLGYQYDTLSKHFARRGAERALRKLNRGRTA